MKDYTKEQVSIEIIKFWIKARSINQIHGIVHMEATLLELNQRVVNNMLLPKHALLLLDDYKNSYFRYLIINGYYKPQ